MEALPSLVANLRCHNPQSSTTCHSAFSSDYAAQKTVTGDTACMTFVSRHVSVFSRSQTKIQCDILPLNQRYFTESDPFMAVIKQVHSFIKNPKQRQLDPKSNYCTFIKCLNCDYALYGIYFTLNSFHESTRRWCRECFEVEMVQEMTEDSDTARSTSS
jgi:hypothetical protein